MNPVAIIMRRLDAIENSIYQLCAMLSAQPGAADAVGRELASTMDEIRKEVEETLGKPSIILPPH